MVTNKITPKQQVILDEMRDGWSFWRACDKAGVSFGDDNRNAMLARMVNNGLLKLTVVEEDS
jgi:hypothetical protein